MSGLGIEIDGVNCCDIFFMVGVVDDIYVEGCFVLSYSFIDLFQIDNVEGSFL